MVQGTLQTRRQKDCKRQRIREFAAEIVSPSNIISYATSFLCVDNYNQNIAYFITILTIENKELEVNVQKSTVH